MNRLVIFVLSIMFWQLSEAGPTNSITMDKIVGGHLGTWSIGDGSQTWTSIHCVGSAKTKNANPGDLPYQMKVTDQDTPPGYYLYLDDIDTNICSARIQVSFGHRDIMEGTALETLSDDAYDSHAHNDQPNGCKQGKNSELQMTIPDSELSKARAGRFYGSYRATAIGGDTGTWTKEKAFSFTIDVSQSVRVSALDNIALGTWAGTGNVIGTESFCIYSNNSSAAYNISISSPQQDAGGLFRIANAGQTQFIGYDLTFADSVGGPGTAVTGNSISGNGNNSAPMCAGDVNAELAVNLPEGNLQPAQSDSYSDTITLLIAPE